MTDLYRDKRDRPSLCVTCAGQNDRDKRDTPSRRCHDCHADENGPNTPVSEWGCNRGWCSF